MNKFSRKNIKNKKGGDCTYTRLQMNKAKSVLGPNGLESQVRKELVNSLSGIHKYLEGDLRNNIKHLQEIFNSNTVRKGDILKIINELDLQLKEVEQRNQSCYDELIIDPRGDDFGKKTSEASILEQYGENPDEYAKAQVNYIEHLLDDHPIVGIVRPTNDEDVEDENADAEEPEAAVNESSNAPEWQKKDSTTMLKSYDKRFEMNYFKLMSDVNNFLRRNKASLAPRQKEIAKILPDIEKAESPEEVQTIINDNNLTLMKANMGGGKSKRINKTRKYMSRRQ